MIFKKMINLINLKKNIKIQKCYFKKKSFNFINYNEFIKNTLFELY